jgi:hypothetical protein
MLLFILQYSLLNFCLTPLTSQLIPHFPCISKDFLFFQLTSTFIFSSFQLISPLLCPCGTFIQHNGSGELVGLYFSGKFMVLGVLRQLGAIGPGGTHAAVGPGPGGTHMLVDVLGPCATLCR